MEKLANDDWTSTVNNVRAIEEFRSLYHKRGHILFLLSYPGRLFRSNLKFEATVTKDRIYALLNLTSQKLYTDAGVGVSKALAPNYRQTDGQLFKNIAEHLLRTLNDDQQLDILVHAGLLPGNRTPDTPLWAQDWAARPVSLPLIGLDGTKELLGHMTLSSRLLSIATMRSYGDFSLNKMLGLAMKKLHKNAESIPNAFYRAGFPRFQSFRTPGIFNQQLGQKALLRVSGISIGRVAHLASRFGSIGTPLKIQRQGLVRLNPAAFLPPDWRTFGAEHSDQLTLAYGRTVLGDLSQTWINLTEESIPTKAVREVFFLVGRVDLYENFLDSCFACESTEQQFFVDDAEHKFYNLDKSIRIICSGRILGVTEPGQLGLFPAGTGIGDSVSVFIKGSVPFVLRAVGGEVMNDGVYEPFHQLVGPCYTHEPMYGKALDNVSPEQLRWYNLE